MATGDSGVNGLPVVQHVEMGYSKGTDTVITHSLTMEAENVQDEDRIKGHVTDETVVYMAVGVSGLNGHHVLSAVVEVLANVHVCATRLLHLQVEWTVPVMTIR